LSQIEIYSIQEEYNVLQTEKEMERKRIEEERIQILRQEILVHRQLGNRKLADMLAQDLLQELESLGKGREEKDDKENVFLPLMMMRMRKNIRSQ
jgi:hypothetical protein